VYIWHDLKCWCLSAIKMKNRTHNIFRLTNSLSKSFFTYAESTSKERNLQNKIKYYFNRDGQIVSLGVIEVPI